MHKEILSDNQVKLLPLVKTFSTDFGLVGGTAIALHLGHRRSIDFDLFIDKDFVNEAVRSTIRANYAIQTTLIDETDELTVVVDGVKLTFYKYPYKINYSDKFEDIISIPDVLTLAAMKAFALGRRAKWKDYVDMFFIFKYYPFREVVNKSREIFGPEFNERLFREQLSYYEDIDNTEKVNYSKGMEVADPEVKKQLSQLSLE